MRTGYTLIELILIIALMGLLASGGMIVSTRVYYRRALVQTLEQVRDLLYQARSNALDNVNLCAIGSTLDYWKVKVTTTKASILYSCAASETIVRELPMLPGVTATSEQSVSFLPLMGSSPIITGDFIFQHTALNAEVKSLQVNGVGGIL